MKRDVLGQALDWTLDAIEKRERRIAELEDALRRLEQDAQGYHDANGELFRQLCNANREITCLRVDLAAALRGES